MNLKTQTKKKISVVTDQDYLPELLKLLSKAKKQIDVMSFSFAIGSAAGKHALRSAPYEIAQKLIEIKKKKSAIKIRFFFEGLRETWERNKVTADYLEENGIEVKSGSTHAKGFCIDGRYVLFGSTNLTQQSLTKNFEANLLIDNKEIAKEFTRYFDHHWEGGEHGEIHLKLPMLADGDFKDELLHMIERAKKTIDFSIYFFSHREIEHALIHAHKRGIAIKGFIHQHANFAMSYIFANRSTYKRMQKSGIKDLYFGPLNTFSHSKYIIVDGKEVMLGTGNWLVQDVQIHPQLYIFLSNRSVGKKLIEHLKKEIGHERPSDKYRTAA